jgi:hypothetical protein
MVLRFFSYIVLHVAVDSSFICFRQRRCVVVLPLTAQIISRFCIACIPGFLYNYIILPSNRAAVVKTVSTNFLMVVVK